MARHERMVAGGRVAIYRHPWPVRLTHWVNACCVIVLLMSGLQILNAHPALYWGETSTFDAPILAFDAPFPAWITLPGWPDLANGRRWHFFFGWLLVINGAAYVLHGLASGRARHVLLPEREQLRRLGRSLLDHLRLHFPQGEEARRYNVLQKLSYLAVMFGLLPLMMFTGLMMSPGMNAWMPWATEIVGGRQSARTVHFVAAAALVLFFAAHMIAILAARPLNALRSIVTGWFVLDTKEFK